MTEELVGKVIRQHTKAGFNDIGRIVHVSKIDKAVYWVPFPELRPDQMRRKKKGQRATNEAGAKVFYIRAVQCWKEEKYRRKLKNHSLVAFKTPRAWRYTDAELRTGFAQSDIGTKHRRNTLVWLEERDRQREWIKPIESEYSEYELLELGRLNDLVRDRAKELGHKTPAKVARAMRLHLLGCGHPNALLPARARCGCPGTEKYTRTKSGRPKRAVARGRTSERGLPGTESTRSNLVTGWRKYKRNGTSEEKAYLLTCAEFWPGRSIVKGPDDEEYLLAPQNKRPTVSEFRYAAHRAKLNATRANMSDRVYRLTARALRGKAADGIIAVGQVGLIDSTSEDQTPVSVASRLKVCPSTSRTIVMDVKTQYIFGVHSGFENPSTLTSLLALHNAAMDKVAFCAQYGVTIADGEWHKRAFKRVRSDHGELKSEKGIATLNASEAAAEFVRSYGADQKGPIEASHHSLHRRADHGAAGSTRGKRRERGEPRREESACRTRFDNMPIVIKAILFHNNVEIVEDLLTIEMRQDGVAPTRRAVYEWYVEKGYSASEPMDLDLLRTRCLPRIAARIHRDGIHLVNPLDASGNPELIPQLLYSSNWLITSGLLERAGRRVIECEVLLDPNDLSKCHFDHAGEVHELERRTSDPRANELSLCEHLLMIAEDHDVADAMSEGVQNAEARILKDNRSTNQAAKAAKRKEIQAGGSEPRQSELHKRANKAAELKLERLDALGLSGSMPPPSETPQTCDPHDAPQASSTPVPQSESESNLRKFLATQWEES